MERASTFYARFLQLCGEKSRSATNVVTTAGLSSCLVTAWKNGASPKLETVMRLADELGVPATSLLDDNHASRPIKRKEVRKWQYQE